MMQLLSVEGRGVPGPVVVVPDHELVRCIGRGSYGEVWLARTILGESRAVKLVFRRNFEDARQLEREFEGIKGFEPISRSHPSQVSILHVGRNDAEGYFYYVMELADNASGSEGEYIPHTLKLELSRRGRLPL